MTSTTDTSTDPRAAYTAGLRALADLLDTHPDLPLPYEGQCTAMSFHFLSGDAKANLAAAVRAFPGRLDKNDPAESDYDRMYFTLTGRLHGLLVDFTSDRQAVCERVVVGTTEVVVEEPDPNAVAALPKVTRRQVVEQVEWRCHPLLADAEPEPVAS